MSAHVVMFSGGLGSWLTAKRVAAMQAAALGPVLAAERAEAVEQVTREWQFGGWAILMAPVPASANRVIALGQRVTDWLRDRADREQAGHQDAQDGEGDRS